MADVFRTMIVTAELAPLARALAAGLSPRGAGMFTTGLSATGKEPASHFVSTGHVSQDIAAVLVDGELLHAACVAGGANVTLAQCDALVASSDVTADAPFDAFARLDLKLVANL